MQRRLRIIRRSSLIRWRGWPWVWWAVKLLALFVWTMAQGVVVIAGVILVMINVLAHFVPGPPAQR